MYETTLPDELNTFYTCFDLLTVPYQYQYTADVRRTLLRVNMSKDAGLDNIPGRVLRTCANQLVDFITDIFNISLPQECSHLICSELVPIAKFQFQRIH